MKTPRKQGFKFLDNLFRLVAITLRCILSFVMTMGSASIGCILLITAKLLSLLFGKGLYRYLDVRVFSSVMAIYGFGLELRYILIDQLYEIPFKYRFYGDPLPREPEIDWIIAEVLCLKQGGYGGRVHYFGKHSILYFPMYGFLAAIRQSFIFIKRSKSVDLNWLKRKLLGFQKKEMPIWLVIFPEGTRFDPQKSDKLERSQAYADSLELPRLNHVLMPRTTGFEVTLATIKDNFQAIYDVTIIYEGREGYSVQSSPPDMFGFYSGRCRRIHIHLERIAISDVPDSEEERKQWLFKQFQKKDKLIDDFLTTGTIIAPKQSLPLPLSYTIPPILIYGLLLVLATCTKVGRTIWLGATLMYSLVGYLLIQCKFIE